MVLLLTRDDVISVLQMKDCIDVLEKAFLLKREEPRRSTRKIIQLMETHQLVKPGIIKPSTLYRIFKKNRQ